MAKKTHSKMKTRPLKHRFSVTLSVLSALVVTVGNQNTGKYNPMVNGNRM